MTCRICESLRDSRLKIYEDDRIVAMLSDRPAAPGHIIVTTKEHHTIFENLPDDVVEHIFTVANRISTITFETLGAHGTNLIVNNGLAAGQKDPHFMLHIIPRREDDGIDFSWQTKKPSEEEFNELHAKLTAPEEPAAGESQEEIVYEDKADKGEDSDNKEYKEGDKDYLLDSLTRIP